MRTGPNHAWRRLAVLLAVAAMLVQSGCLGGSGRPDRFYQLDVPDAAARLEAPLLRGRLLVEPMRSGAMALDRSMLYRKGDDPYRVRRSGYDKWADPPTVMVQRAAVEFLRSANLAEAVVTPELRLDADFRLAGRIDRFERVLGEGPPHASVEIEFSLVRLGDRELLLLETYREEEAVTEDGFGGSAEAFSQALYRVLERLALDLQRP